MSSRPVKLCPRETKMRNVAPSTRRIPFHDPLYPPFSFPFRYKTRADETLDDPCVESTPWSMYTWTDTRACIARSEFDDERREILRCRVAVPGGNLDAFDSSDSGEVNAYARDNAKIRTDNPSVSGECLTAERFFVIWEHSCA